jgi:uracil phosphoribosyltransferase
MTHPQVHVVSHALAKVHLTALRDVRTSSRTFRRRLNRLGEILFLEASKELETVDTEVETPLIKTTGFALKRTIVLSPILRAGLGLMDGILPLAPDAVVAHLGIARNEATAKPEPYYAKLPAIMPGSDVFLLDPMLATGGSAVEAARQLKAAGAVRLRLLCIVAAPEGIRAFTEAHPDVRVFTTAVDEGLNERCYIVPGLGDAGDRYFGT